MINWTLQTCKSYDPPRRRYTATVQPYDGVEINITVDEVSPNRFTVSLYSNNKVLFAKRRKTDGCEGRWSVMTAKRHAERAAYSSKWLASFGYDVDKIAEAEEWIDP